MLAGLGQQETTVEQAFTVLEEQKASAPHMGEQVIIEEAKWGDDDDIELDDEETEQGNKQIAVGTLEDENNMHEVKLGLSLGTQKSEQQRKGQ